MPKGGRGGGATGGAVLPEAGAMVALPQNRAKQSPNKLPAVAMLVLEGVSPGTDSSGARVDIRIFALKDVVTALLM